MTQEQNYGDKNHTDLEWGGGLWVKHALKGKNGKHHGVFKYTCILKVNCSNNYRTGISMPIESFLPCGIYLFFLLNIKDKYP